MRKFAFPIAVISVLGIFIVSPDLQAQDCRNHDLRGTYGLLVTGTLVVPDGSGGVIPLPFVRLGAPEFDGAGNLGGRAWASVGGQIAWDDFTGTYTVYPNCSVAFWAKVPFPVDPVTFKMAGILSDSFTRLDFMTVEPPAMGVVFLGELQKQRLPDCAKVNLRGSYSLKLSGWDNGISIARFGELTTDGEGKFSATTYISKNGVIRQEKIKGTYKAGTNCTFDMLYDSNGSVQLKGAIFAGGEGAYLMQVDPAGAAIGGSLLRTSPHSHRE